MLENETPEPERHDEHHDAHDGGHDAEEKKRHDPFRRRTLPPQGSGGLPMGLSRRSEQCVSGIPDRPARVLNDRARARSQDGSPARGSPVASSSSAPGSWARPIGKHRHATYAIGVTEKCSTTGASSMRVRQGKWIVLYPDEIHDRRAGTHEEAFGNQVILKRLEPALRHFFTGA